MYKVLPYHCCGINKLIKLCVVVLAKEGKGGRRKRVEGRRERKADPKG